MTTSPYAILQAIKTAVLTKVTSTNVLIDEEQALDLNILPAVVIRAGQETDDSQEEYGSGSFPRILTVQIEMAVRTTLGTPSCSATADLASAVTRAIRADQTLGGIVLWSRLRRREWARSDSDATYAGCLMEWDVNYIYRPTS